MSAGLTCLHEGELRHLGSSPSPEEVIQVEGSCLGEYKDARDVSVARYDELQEQLALPIHHFPIPATPTQFSLVELGFTPASLIMKFSALLTSISFILPSLSHPLEDRDAPQTVHLTFHGGPASYEMTIPADGQIYPTSQFPT